MPEPVTHSHGYAAMEAGGKLQPFDFERRAPGAKDVVLEILFCGICHSDLHLVGNDWGWSRYPMVPGHEIIGRVTAVGTDVKSFKPGDLAGIGCMVDSCGECPPCEAQEENFCQKGFTGTYGAMERDGKRPTYGGYSNNYVVREEFALRVPDNLDPAAAAPLLCAGITTYAPLRRYNAGPGTTVGVIGLGGLGHMAMKLAKAMGARTVLFTTSESKCDAARVLGADDIVLSTNPQQMKSHAASCDLIIDTVSAPHDIGAELQLLKAKGVLVLVGLPSEPSPLASSSLVMGQKTLTGSMIGGTSETQEMLDFCGQHNITADVEVIPIQAVNEAYNRMLKSDVKYRFVIDLASLKEPAVA